LKLACRSSCTPAAFRMTLLLHSESSPRNNISIGNSDGTAHLMIKKKKEFVSGREGEFAQDLGRNP
jgi:hypothetical protein